MSDNCPKCNYHLLTTMIELEMEHFDKDEPFECPKCGAKLKAHMTLEYIVEEDEDESLVK
jgi:hypothetical protein